MAEVVQSLFGVTPQSLMASRDAQLQEQAMAYARMSPLERAAMGTYLGASRLGSAIGGMLGGTDPELEKVKQRQGMLKTADMSTSVGFKELASKLLAIGDYAGAQEAMSKATALEKEEIDIASKKAEIFSKTKPKTTNEMDNATAIANASGNPEGSPEWKAIYAEALSSMFADKKNPMIEKVGLAKGTEQAVYIDKRTNEQFVYTQDPTTGKIVRTPYTGSIDQTTAKVTATASTKAQEAGATEAAKIDAQRMQNVQAAADKAVDKAGTLQALLKTPQGISGSFATARQAALNVFKTLGLASSKDEAALSNSQLFTSYAGEQVLSFIKSLGANPSEGDRQFAAAIGPQLEKGIKTNKDLIEYLLKRANDVQEEADNMSEYFYNNNYSLKGYKSTIRRNLQIPSNVSSMSPDELAAAAGGKIVNGKFVPNAK